MLHLGIFTSSLAQSANFNQVNALADGLLNVQNNNVVIGALNQVLAVHGYGAHLERIQLKTPSLATPFLPDFPRTNKAVPTNAINPGVNDLVDSPFTLPQTEQLTVQAVQSNAGSETEYVGIWFSDQPVKPVSGQIRTVRLTGTTTLTAGALTTAVALTFEQNLPKGKYTCVGARFQSATGVYARLYVAGLAWHPGGLAVTGNDTEGWPRQRRGMMGAWFDFDNTTQISSEWFATAGDTAQTVEMDLIGPQ